MECSEDEAIAALLHDVVEDGGGPEAEAEIARSFRRSTLPASSAPTPTASAGRRSRLPWRQRKEDYIASIPAKAPDELRVSVADKLHNARSILSDLRRHGDEVWPRFAGRRKARSGTTAR